MHTTVFLDEAVEALNVQKNELYVDATYGAGGHSSLIAEKGGKVVALDLDPSVRQENPQITLLTGNFANIESILKEHKIKEVSGVLFDYGLSMNQIVNGGKGLSYKALDEHLDMRLSGEGITAAEILNTYSEDELTDLFMKYAEDTNSMRYVRGIQTFGRKNEFVKVRDLIEALDSTFKNAPADKRLYAPIFQALRIEVNREYETIPQGLEGAFGILKKGGTIVTITFHSLEDRWVKRFIREHKNEINDERIEVSKKRAVRSFERSATLRVMKKI
jgi:16S rRNA (cytosine1402-N4)-methyltransferase